MTDYPKKLPAGKKIILFDGVCNFCDNTVQMLIRHDKQDQLRFAPLESEIGRELLKNANEDIRRADSIILYDTDGRFYSKSKAAIKIAGTIGGFYSFIRIFSLLPSSLNDYVYDFIAKNRYRWYGRKDECMIPTPEIRSKFLTD